MVVSPTHTPPPIADPACKYQLPFTEGGRTAYQCYTEQEYQTKVQQDAAATQASTKAMNDWFAHNWLWIVLGVIVVFSAVLIFSKDDNPYGL